ncbi:hypothetical protein CEE35_09500 [Candidatus Aerophobetes bacterium Ae_b3b]|nr:MAG: hypothetical protein CEE35_09500 [Candidatus Aerophobetes bacterium Ae_b3b]
MKSYNPYGIYIPRYHKQSRFYNIFANHFEDFLSNYYSIDELYSKYGDITDHQTDTVHKFLKCQDLTQGFGVAKCPSCGTAYIVPFSCKKHKICPSCRMKKLLEYSEWLKQEVLLELTHRHWVFTIPKELRVHFYRNRFLLNKLIETACRFLVFIYRKFLNLPKNQKKKAHPGIVGILQTAGSDLKFNPHCHLISTEGVLIEKDEDDLYVPVNFLPYDYIRIAWRNRVLNMLYNFKEITSQERKELKERYKSGFNFPG